MKRILAIYYTVILFLAVGLASCTPPTSPVTPPPPAVLPTPVPQNVLPPSVSLEEAAWVKVVQAARKEGTLTAYSYYWVGDRGIALARAFRQRYGINLEIVTGRGAEFLERLKTEKRVGKVMADVFEGSAVHGRNVTEDGLTVSLADLPILQEKEGWNINPRVFDPTANMLLNLPWTMTPYLNTNLVKPPDVPKTWNDLLLPKWKGKIVTTDPNVSNLSYYWLLLVKHGAFSMDFIQGMAQQELGYVKGAPDIATVLARGEYALTPNQSDNTMAEVAAAGAPIKAVEVDKGAMLSGLVVVQVKGGPHPNAARVFINWLLSDEGQKVQAEVSGTLSMRQAVPDYRHPATRVRLIQPLSIGVEENLQIAQDFRDKVMVNLLRKPR